jgi:hypothetical protein
MSLPSIALRLRSQCSAAEMTGGYQRRSASTERIEDCCIVGPYVETSVENRPRGFWFG